jgi:hypothetical protein
MYAKYFYTELQIHIKMFGCNTYVIYVGEWESKGNFEIAQ